MDILDAVWRENRLQLPPKNARVVMDTDTFNEVDDQFAVVYAARCHMARELRLEAYYAAPFSHINQPDAGKGMELSYNEIHKVLAKAGYKEGTFPVFRGSNRYMNGKITDSQTKPEKGEDYGKPVDSPAVRDLIERAMQSPDDDPLYVLTIGCATNIASALLLEPRIKEKIVMVWLAATSTDWPNIMEYNFRQDLAASHVIFESGVPLILLPAYNVICALRTTVYELEHFIDGKNEISSYLTSIVRKYSQNDLNKNPNLAYSKVIWDIASVAFMIHPEMIHSKLIPTPHFEDDLHWSKEQPTNNHLMRIVTYIDRDITFTDLFNKLVNT